MCDPEVDDIDGLKTAILPPPKEKKLKKMHPRKLYLIACDLEDPRHLDALENFLTRSRNPNEGKIRTLTNLYKDGPGKIILDEHMQKIK